WLLDAGHRSRSEPCTLDGKPRDRPPWRARAGSRQRNRSAGPGGSPAAQAVPAGPAQQAAGEGFGETDAGLVAATNFRMAEAALPGRQEHARVARNHLSQLIHSSARSAETGAGSASAITAADPSFAARQRSRTLPRPDRGCCLHPRKTCGSRRSCHSRTLGGRSVARGAQQSRSHSGGASFAFLHAGEGARQRHRYGGGRLEPARAPTPSDAASLANLGPRAGDGRAQKLHHGYGCAGLLLRSTKSLAARIERKHEWAIAAISAEEGGPNPLLAVGSGRDRFTAESTAATNVGISHSGG